MQTYRGATIFTRYSHNKHWCEYAFDKSRSRRFFGGSAINEQVALMKTRQTIDAVIKAEDITNRWFRMKLIGD